MSGCVRCSLGCVILGWCDLAVVHVKRLIYVNICTARLSREQLPYRQRFGILMFIFFNASVALSACLVGNLMWEAPLWHGPAWKACVLSDASHFAHVTGALLICGVAS